MANCPGAAHGHSGYVPGRGNLSTAEFFYLGEAPGVSEAAWKRCPSCRWEGEESSCPQCRGASTLEPWPSPFVGKAGKLARKMLRSAGIDPSRVYFSNVIKCRPPDNKYPAGPLRVACEGHCQPALIEELRQFAENSRPAKVIIAAGAQAMRALTGLDSITERRGYVYIGSEDFSPLLPIDYLPVIIPTIHPSFIFRSFDTKQDSDAAVAQRSWLPITIGDYIKASRIVATRQLRRPPSIWTCDSVAQMLPRNGWQNTDHVTLDLEYDNDTITVVGAGYGDCIAAGYCRASGTSSGDRSADLGALQESLAAAPLLVGHNLITADLPVLERNGVIPSIEAVLDRVVDTQIVQHLLYPDHESGMDFWGSIVTDLPYWKDMPDKGEDVRVYCGRDVYGADQLFEKGRAQLAEMGMEHLLPISQRAQCALYRMSERGVKIAQERIPAAKQQLEERIAELAAQMPFANWRSNPQVKEHFSSKYRVRKGVDKHVLIGFIQKHGDPIAKMLLEARELDKIRSTYLEPYAEAGDVIHSRFDVTKQGTGRISSMEPNLFQLPKKAGKATGDLGLRLVRSLIVPRHPGWVLVEADWQQAELRLAAHFAEARVLEERLNSGADIHELHALTFGVPRDIGKIVTYASIYKASVGEIARSNDLLPDDVQKALTGLLKEYPEIPRWWDAVVKAVLANQGVQKLPSGRIRRYWGRVEDWEKAAISTMDQGTVADMLLRVLWLLEMESRQHLQARILCPCHDAVLWECPPDEVEQVVELSHTYMEQPWDFLDGFRLPIDLKSGPSWAEVKKL